MRNVRNVTKLLIIAVVIVASSVVGMANNIKPEYTYIIQNEYVDKNKPYDSNKYATRDDFVGVVVRSINGQVENGLNNKIDSVNNFDDIKQSYYYDEIIIAKDEGVINGISENKFGVGNNITRQEGLVIVYNVLVKLNKIQPIKDTNSINLIKDNDLISNYAKIPIATLVENGIVSNEVALYPKENITNGELAYIAYNLYNFIDNDKNYQPIKFDEPVKEVKIKETDFSKLDSQISKYGNDISVYYENINTGEKYVYNGEKMYFSASIVKAMYALYIYDNAVNGKFNLEKSHTYTSGLYVGGTGVIKNMKTGSTFNEKDLLKYAIRNSDNIALKILINQYGVSGFKEYVNQLGLDSKNVNNITNANMNVEFAGVFMRNIYDFLESDNAYAKQFKTDLMSTSNPMITSKYNIARKYGWATKSFHDMAIVYSDSPYILVIMSTKENGTANDFKVFNEISKIVETFNDSNFVGK